MGRSSKPDALRFEDNRQQGDSKALLSGCRKLWLLDALTLLQEAILKFVFMDEQEAEKNGRAYTAVSCAIFDESDIQGYREELVPKLAKLFWPDEVGKNIIRKFPKIHGSDLLSGHTDFTKIECVSSILKCAVSHGGLFFRVGYFNDSLPPNMDRMKRIAFCVSRMIYPVQEAVDGRYFVVHEMDIRSLDAGYLSPDVGFDRYLQTKNFRMNISIDMDRLVGFSYAHKSDLGCIAADLFGYVSSKYHKTKLTEFGKSIANLYEIARPNNIHDQIIALNWG